MNELALVAYHYGLLDNLYESKVKCICPIHADLKPSMLLDLEHNTYFCFGCNARGDTIDLIKSIQKCDDIQAYYILSKIKAGKNRDILDLNYVEQPRMTNKQAIIKAKNYFYTLPKTNWFNVEKDNYILQRGFEPRTLNKLDFRINYNHIYGIVAPMIDNGKFKGYVQRATVSEFNGREIDRKYLYNKGFSRYNTLVGSYNDDWVVVTEGFLDYAKAVHYGIKNSCAILGWKITNNQISKIQQHTTKVISALDNTPTGRAGTKYLREYFDVVRFQFPSSCKDLGDIEDYQWRLAWKKTMRKVEAYERKAKFDRG